MGEKIVGDLRLFLSLHTLYAPRERQQKRSTTRRAHRRLLFYLCVFARPALFLLFRLCAAHLLIVYLPRNSINICAAVVEPLYIVRRIWCDSLSPGPPEGRMHACDPQGTAAISKPPGTPPCSLRLIRRSTVWGSGPPRKQYRKNTNKQNKTQTIQYKNTIQNTTKQKHTKTHNKIKKINIKKTTKNKK